MLVFHETVPCDPQSSLSCRDFDLKQFDAPYHRHHEFEVVRIDASSGRMLAGDYAGEFGPGQIYVFGSLLPHAFLNYSGTRKAQSRCLQFDPDRFQEAFSVLPETGSVSAVFHRSQRGLLLHGRAATAVSRALDRLFVAREIKRLIEMFHILQTLYESEGIEDLTSEGYSLQSPDRQLSRLERVLHHIHVHSAEPLAMADLAVLAGMSESAFHRLFRERLSRTPGAYIQDVRLAAIARRLLESDASISEIAFDEGYNNLSNFNRQFRSKFNCSPREYRSTIKDVANTTVPHS